jgi:glycine hydroxymethyltransferase
VDLDDPGKRVPAVQLRALRDAGKDALIDLAFQGPLSLPMLVELAGDGSQRAALEASRLNDVMRVTVKGIPVIAARTGYTGEEVGFELFVHPDRALELWELLLEHGRDRGVLAAGLGARDSLRTEAGLPLFGHELEGDEQLSLTEADYGFISRFHRPFYVGRKAYIERLSPRRKRLLRLKGSGKRTVRAGHAIVDDEGQAVGVVTSFAFSDASYDFHVLAAVRESFQPKAGRVIRGVRAKPDEVTSPIDERKVVDLSVLTRFPTPEEKQRWKEKYRKA